MMKKIFIGIPILITISIVTLKGFMGVYRENIRKSHKDGFYKSSYYSMQGLASSIKDYEEKCGKLPDNISLKDFIVLEKCPEWNIKSDLKEVDRWGNPISVKEVEGERMLISCGAEWMEYSVDGDNKYINSVKKYGETSPYFLKIKSL